MSSVGWPETAGGRSLGPADRLTKDSRNSTLTSVILNVLRTSRHLKAAVLASSMARDLGFTPIHSGVGGAVYANDIKARPFNLQFLQACKDLGSHLVLPGGVELMVDKDPELFKPAVGLRACRLLP